MEDLILKAVYTALIVCLCSVAIMKFYEFDELPYWIASSTVIVSFISAAIFIIGAITCVWI